MLSLLRDLRIKNKYQQKYIAELLHINQSAYSMIENGQRGLSVDNAKTLGRLYGVNWWQFFETEQDS